MIPALTTNYSDVFNTGVLSKLQPIELYNLCKTNKNLFEKFCGSINGDIINKGIKTIDCADHIGKYGESDDNLSDISIFTRFNELYIVSYKSLFGGDGIAFKPENTPIKIDIGSIKVLSVCCNDHNIFVLSIDGSIYQLDLNNLIQTDKILSYSNPIKLDVTNVLAITTSSYSLMINTINSIYEYDYSEKILKRIYDSSALYISCGHNHCMIILMQHILIGYGDNSHGQLGNGKISEYEDLIGVNIDNVLSVSCGNFHTIALTQDHLYAWGDNSYDQLCIKNVGDTSRPMIINSKILVNNNILGFSCGATHTMVLTTDGLYGYGWDGGNIFSKRSDFSRISKLIKTSDGAQKINVENVISVVCKDTQTILTIRRDNKERIRGFKSLIAQERNVFELGAILQLNKLQWVALIG